MKTKEKQNQMTKKEMERVQGLSKLELLKEVYEVGIAAGSVRFRAGILETWDGSEWVPLTIRRDLTI